MTRLSISVLAALGSHPDERLNVTRLSRDGREPLSYSQCTYIVQGLQKRGLVTTVRVARERFVVLTERGSEAAFHARELLRCA